MSNLLDKASIILTPTAYNNGEALCVKPSDGSGDFDFSRNSAATRVNAQGLVENVQILSSNLVQNPSFSEEGVQEVSNGSFSQEGAELITNGDFSNGSTGWDLRGVTTVYDDKANTVSTSSEYILLQNSVTTIGKQYKITYDLVVDSGTFVTYYDTVNLSSRYRTTSGTYTEYFEAVSLNMAFRSVGNFTGSIDNVSCVEVGQDWTLGTGWSIAEDKANGDGSGTAYSIALQSTPISAISGNTVKLEYTILNYVSGSIRPTLGVVNGLERNSNGTFIEYIKLGSNAPALQLVNRATALNGSITNISVKEVGMDWETNDANITIQGGYASFNSPNTYTRLTNTPTTNIIQGKTYKAKCTVSNYVSGICYFRMPFNNASGSNRITSNGEYEFISVADNNYSNIVIAAASSNAVMDITNISVIEITDDTNLPRINYEGFSYQDALGSELNTNTYIADKSANLTLNGTELQIDNGGENYARARVNAVLVSGKTYRAKVTCVNQGTNGASFYVLAGRPFGTINMISGETYEVTFVADSFYTPFYENKVGGTGLIVDNISIKEYLGQEVVPNSGCGSWLFEPQSTNLITQSELFSDASWNASTDVIIDKGYLAPDGTNNATKVTVDGASPKVALFVSGVGPYTKSIYARTVSGTGTMYFGEGFPSGTNELSNVTEQWQRFEVTNTLSNFYAADFRGASTLTEVIIWGAQFEDNISYATSYIPTSGSTVTRNQDVCTNGGSLATINSTEGTLYFEGSALADNTGTFRSIALSDGTTNNRVLISYTDATNTIRVLVFRDNGLQVIMDRNINATDTNKLAISYKFNEVEIWINGVKEGTDTNAFMPIGLNELSFSRGDGDLPFFGKTKCLAVFPYLTDAELTELTTI